MEFDKRAQWKSKKETPLTAFSSSIGSEKLLDAGGASNNSDGSKFAELLASELLTAQKELSQRLSKVAQLVADREARARHGCDERRWCSEAGCVGSKGQPSSVQQPQHHGPLDNGGAVSSARTSTVVPWKGKDPIEALANNGRGRGSPPVLPAITLPGATALLQANEGEPLFPAARPAEGEAHDVAVSSAEEAEVGVVAKETDLVLESAGSTPQEVPLYPDKVEAANLTKCSPILTAEHSCNESAQSEKDELEHYAETGVCSPDTASDGPKPILNKKGSDGKFSSESSKLAKIITFSAMTEECDCETAQMSESSSHDDTFSIVQSDHDEFKLLPYWAERKQTRASRAKHLRANARKMSLHMFNAEQLTAQILSQAEHWDDTRAWLQALVIHPNCLARVSWDLCSVGFLAFDMVVQPFQLFEPPTTTISILFQWLSRLFWTADMILSTVTGYIKDDGSIELRPPKILFRYLSSHFMLDAFLVFLDWLELFWSGDAGTGLIRLGKASRGARVIRMFRLFRLIRVQQLLTLMDEYIRSDKVMVVADVFKITMVIVFCSHLSACVWYGLGNHSNDAWVAHFIPHDADIVYRYTLSLHWAILQFAGGTDEVHPTNAAERAFAVLMFISCFMLAAVLVSNLTSEITRLTIISNQHSQQLSILRRFLSDHGVSSHLAMRVQRNARHGLKVQQKNMLESSVQLLGMVSQPLLMELHFELYSPLLCHHPFFKAYTEECPHVMRKLCHQCISIHIVHSGDVIFSPGETPDTPMMFIIMHGLLEYFTLEGRQETIDEGRWISEAALWCHWTHRGGLRAKTDSTQICQLNAKAFQDIVKEFEHQDFQDFDVRRYAADYVWLLNNSEMPVSDLSFVRSRLMEELPYFRLLRSRSSSRISNPRQSGGKTRASRGRRSSRGALQGVLFS